MKKLFYNMRLTGHHSEYISHLVDYLEMNKDCNIYFFVVNPDFSIKFPSIADKAKKVKNITWIEVTPEEHEMSQKGGMIKKTFSEYKLMHKYATQYVIDHVCLLYFNTFQLACALFRPPYNISGVLFLQFYRMDKTGLKEKLKYYRKYLTTKFYALNPKVKSIFILNDDKTAKYLNNEFKTSIFKMLPDPIPELSPLEDFDIYKHYNLQAGRKIFLHIGGLGDRKGTFEIIDATQYIPDEIQKDIAILLVGKATNQAAEQTIVNKMEQGNSNTKVQIVWDNQFVSNPMMKSLFEQCDAVLIPYKNAEASSGILGHAIASGKTVIATGKGLLKEIIEENRLGILIDDVTPTAVASKIEYFLSSKHGGNISDQFILEHNPGKFAEIIISN